MSLEGVLGFMALSHREELVSRLCDGEHGFPRDMLETSREGFAQLPPANIKEAIPHAGSMAECCVERK